MAVYASRSLVESAPPGFIHHLGTTFSVWKRLPFHEQMLSEIFGADGDYVRPLVDETTRLMHVHLGPSRKNRAAFRRWKEMARRGWPPTSDRHLIYVANPDQDYCLIELLADGTAHKVATMADPTDEALMYRCANRALQWIQNPEGCTDTIKLCD